jgi:KDO2-lipid IV(A) lauroyltransferase
MAKPRSLVFDYLVYLLVRLAVAILQALPLETAYRFARFIGWLGYHLNRRHRLVADENLEKAFPGRWTPAQRDRIIRGLYVHFAMMLVELVHLPRLLHIHNYKRHMRLENGEFIVRALLADRAPMLVTGHFGNWEMASYNLGLLGFRIFPIARALDNRYIDEFLRRFRQRYGQTVLAKNDDYARIQEVLETGGVLGTLADQDAGQRGLFVDFFGRPASTHKAVALLCLEYKVPLLVIGMYREKVGLRYVAVAEDLIDPAEYEGRPDAIKAITQRFTSAFERLVRRAPEQYLWLHRRWKHQPRVREKKQAA